MKLTLQLSSLELDFENDEGITTLSKDEQDRITKQQLNTPVVFDITKDNYRELFHLDDIQDWAIDEISNRSGWRVDEFSFT